MPARSPATRPCTASRTCSSARPPISSNRALSCSSSSWKWRTRSVLAIRSLSESTRHIIFRQFLGWVGKNLVRPIGLHQLPEPEERGHIGHARRLLHVVRDDDDRVAALQLVYELFDPLRR